MPDPVGGGEKRPDGEAAYELRRAFDAVHPGYGDAMFGEMSEGIIAEHDRRTGQVAELREALEWIATPGTSDTAHIRQWAEEAHKRARAALARSSSGGGR